MTNEMNRELENALIECLEALDGGADLESCLARFPELATELRPHLELRAGLASFDIAAPSPVAYQQGREALLERLAGGAAQPAVLPPLVARDGWRLSDLLAGLSLSRLQTPLSRVAAAFGALFLLGGAIGVSAAAGFEPARDVLSALHIVDNDDDGDKNAEGPQDPPKSDDDKDVAPEPTKDDDDDRPVATKTPTPKADDERPVATKTPTPKRDSDPVKPTATKKSRDVDPSDRRPTKTPTPRRIRPTNTPYHEPTKTPEEEKPTKTPEPPKPTKTATPTKKPDEPI
jgi:hypothetical protein